ncbi:MAG: hypothetical protein LBH20_06060 [Treponema sp.]|nr:hypothetical protein [Treponema sp.]
MSYSIPNDHIVDFRCCLCPNGDFPDRTICPPGGPGNKKKSPCRFVVTFLDDNGQMVFVSSGIDTTKKKWFSVRQKDTRHGTHRVKTKALPIRTTFDEAQRDLNSYAAKRRWQRRPA